MVGDTRLGLRGEDSAGPAEKQMHLRRPGELFRGRAPRRVSALRLLICATLSIVFSSFTSRAYAADLSGTWSASSLRVSWSIGDWGKACGPRPSGGGERGGTVTLTQSGSDFKLSGLGRSYSSNQCWERMPGLSSRGHSAGSSAIQTTCKMPAGDPRQATVVTTWYPRGDEIYFDETGQYQFVVSGSNCTASVRRTRVLTRVVEKTEPEPVTKEEVVTEKADAPKKADPPAQVETTKKEAPSAAPPPPPARASHCAKAGKAVSLEVTPKTKLMRVGETFQFQAIARDKNGCRAAVDTEWKLVSGEGGKLKPDGTLSVPSDAPTGTLTLEAHVDDQNVKVTARIVTEEEYEALIAGGEYGVMGESLDAASITLSTSHVEFDKSAQEEGDSGNKSLLLIIGGLIIVLGGTALALLSRRSKTKPKKSPQAALQEVPAEEPPAPPPEPTEAAPPPKPARLCPVCGKRYEDETMFCGEDGARLVRAN